MRYKIRKAKPAKIGDIRTKYKFLIFPKCIKGEVRWLEKAKWKEKLVEELLFTPEGFPFPVSSCRSIKWINK